jgi:hypothetical protein
MAWWSWLHGLTVAVVVMVASQRWRWLCCIVLWWLRGVVVTVVVAWLDDGCGRWWQQWRSCHVVLQWLHDVAWWSQSHGLMVGWLWQVVAAAVMVASWRWWQSCHVMLQWLCGMAVAVTWLDGCGHRWWLWRLQSCHGGRSCCVVLQWLHGVVVVVVVAWLNDGCGRWWRWWWQSCHGGSGHRVASCCGGCVMWHGGRSHMA